MADVILYDGNSDELLLTGKDVAGTEKPRRIEKGNFFGAFIFVIPLGVASPFPMT
jgi:hypothetical protein